MCRDRSDLQLNSAGHSLHFHVIHKIINGTASERTLIALNIFFMHPGHMPFKVVLTHRLYSHILHAISSFSFQKKFSLELSGNKTSSSISIFDTVKQPPPNIFSMSKHSWNMDIFHMYCKILFRFRFIVTHLIACPPSWVILMCFCKAVSVQTEKSHSSQK